MQADTLAQKNREDVAALCQWRTSARTPKLSLMGRKRHDNLQDNFDVAWKHLIEEMFPEFLRFYFPETAEIIDWTAMSSTTHAGRDTPETGEARRGLAPWRFLNQELQQIHPDSETGSRVVDRLVEVRVREGSAQRRYIHIEVQNQPNAHFAERMYSYHYRIFDRFKRPVESLALLTDTSADWRPATFETRGTGTSGCLTWQTVKLLDYQGQEGELAKSRNPFGWVTLAHLAAQETQGKLDQRVEAKRTLMRLAVSHGWDHKRIILLFRALDFMMRLPPGLNQKLWCEIDEQGSKPMEMPLCDWELGFIERGRAEGMQKGEQKGLEQGRTAEAALVCRQLSRRFGALSADTKSKIMAGSFEDLDRWGSRLLDVESLDEVFEQD